MHLSKLFFLHLKDPIVLKDPQLKEILEKEGLKKIAEIIRKKLNLKKIYFSKNILEIKSHLKDRPLAELEATLFDLYLSPKNAEGGESMIDVSKRMEKFIKKITKLHSGKRIAVVSHGDPIMIAKAQYESLPLVLKSIRTNGAYIKTSGVYLLKI